ncbi:MAG: type II toxin-antitoxin system HicB family antitoxin [Rubrobacter sp.]|nr:type II toxin-antitoxin system HicB family antitoxin [Rubrobacter sp.]
MADRFEVRIQWSDADEAFVAWTPDIKFCTAHGETVEEAACQIRDAIAGNIEVAREFGDPMPEPLYRLDTPGGPYSGNRRYSATA